MIAVGISSTHQAPAESRALGWLGAIIAWRDANGSFTSVDQLADVDGIGPARLEKLRAQVHV